MRTMAFVTGKGSTLNPNAEPFIPAFVRQVEDFSPEWWHLATNYKWFHDYWLGKEGAEYDNKEPESGPSGDDDIADLLPDNIDLGVDEDILTMESQYEEFLQLRETEQGNNSSVSSVKGVPASGSAKHSGAPFRRVRVARERSAKSPVMPPKYSEKPANALGPKSSPRLIQQPR